MAAAQGDMTPGWGDTTSEWGDMTAAQVAMIPAQGGMTLRLGKRTTAVAQMLQNDPEIDMYSDIGILYLRFKTHAFDVLLPEQR